MATETGEGSAGTEDASTGSEDASAEVADADAEAEEAETEASSGPTQHQRAVIVTTGATLLGMIAGVASMLFATTGGSPPEPDNLLGFGMMMLAVVVQFPLYSLLGIDSDDLGTKDQIYIFAMTFIMWFVTWSIFLTTGALV